ncbi:UPF0182 family protein [Cloacibacillus porcorum]|uniref:UPF0182 family membrane protein n=1 Tax=Cloacibacillus porcorum TaxID=1197717 RepID=UPI0023F31194|nr:UPF0182 family protein [Cloacibacillus porcorum]MDD7650497.1 UPF0182 family protein [Cloacibacillus porcorum]MDY4094822.1 UPF0182 family protein [Cloacibacillus porcorum]
MDINDLLRSMMNRPQREWTQGSGDNGENWDDERPQMPRIELPKVKKFWFVAGGLFILFAVVLPWIATFMTDLYWFEAQGFESVFWRRFWAQWELFAAALVPGFIIYSLNWQLAWRRGLRQIDDAGADARAGRRVRLFILGAALLVAAVNALNAMGMWHEFLQFMNKTPFGETDPLFGIDIGFYVFSLPFLKFLQLWTQGVLMLTLIGSAAIYFMTRSVSFTPGRLYVAPAARLHLTLLGALILILWGVGYWVARYELLFSPTGVVFGAGYTDVHVVLPALSILTFAMFAAAALLFVNFFRPMWKFSAVAIGLLLVVGWAARSVVPGLVQQYRVKPNEYEMEKSYLDYHLDYTRRAFGLNKVTSVAFTPEAEVTAAELAADNETVQNIRLWDYSPLLRTYRQLQAIRTYYNFNDVYIDRYMMEGRSRQVMLGVRELDLSRLQNPTWVNTHLEFTHGYGVVMNPVNEIASGGLPYFFMKDIPVRSTVDIPLSRPEIYFGTAPYSYVLVKTDVKEFDYPMGDSNVRSVYQEDGGVAIGSLWRRILFSLRFRDSEILFTGALSKESRVLYNRNVRRAFAQVAPFLIYDAETYPVLIDGRIKWLQDAFTWSERYPYSKPFDTADSTLAIFRGVNYVRNSVKGVADAYTGKMEFYVVDDKDPIIRTWMKIFPGLFRDRGGISEELWQHIRYPEDFFEVQTAVYTTYHMTDTNTYYNREDVWEVTPVGRERRIQPNYVTMKLWGEKSPEFAIIVPYMPLGRDNLIGWMAGRCDPQNYGELLVYQFPKQKLIYGPGQVEALIDQNPEISAQLSLWSQRGSDVIRGDLLVVPIGKSLLYVQPLYLKAEKGELPELKRVIVSTGGRVAWADNFGSALEKLMGQKMTLSTGTKTESVAAAPVAGSSEGGADTDIKALASEAQELYNAAQNAQRNGDWAGYGEKIGQLGEVLGRMRELTD